MAAGAIPSDFTKNYKAGKLTEHREEMMKHIRARGEFVEQKLIFCVGDKEFPKTPAEGLHLRAKNKNYRFRVRFEDPRTAKEREAVSERYSWFSPYEYERVNGKREMVSKLREKEAYVYVDLEGNAWGELIPVR